MVTAAKTVSQLATHMGIAFTLMYAMTGSVAFGGLAALLEPLGNVMLLPLHQRLWAAVRRGAAARARLALAAAEKASQVGLHMGVAFGVMYAATGSIASGGLAALLEPICNVLVLPLHDRQWEKLRRRLENGGASGWVAA